MIVSGGRALVSAESSQRRNGSAAFVPARTARALRLPRCRGSGHRSASITGTKAAKALVSIVAVGTPKLQKIDTPRQPASISRGYCFSFFSFLMIPCPLAPVAQGAASSAPAPNVGESKKREETGPNRGAAIPKDAARCG